MDPDQVDAGDVTAYAGGGGRAGGGEESWARALLRRGWDLSRKAAIVGVAVTAAPVVAPPIIILSVAGVALSVPFAACLASVAVTDRLTTALLPPPKPHYYTYYDYLEDEELKQEFVEAPDEEEDSVFGHWSNKTEEEQSESFASLPLSQEPRLLQELVDVPRDAAAMKGVDDDGYITMEAPSPGGQVSELGVHVLRKEDNTVQRMDKDAPVPAQESSVSDNENETEDGKSTSTEENQCTKKSLDTTDLAMPMSHNNDTMVQRDVEGEASVKKTGERHFDLSDDNGGKTDNQKIMKNTDNESPKGLEHYGERGMPSMVTEGDDRHPIPCRSRLNVSSISESMTTVGRKPHSDFLNQTTCVANKELGKEEVADDKCVKTEETKIMDVKVPTTDLPAQDEYISKSLVRDDQSTREDEVTVEMVLEEVSSSIDPVTGEDVEVQVDVIAGEIESLPLSDLVAHDLHVPTGAGTIDDKTEDIVTGIGDINVVDLDHQSGVHASSFDPLTSVLTVDDGEGLLSSTTTPYVTASDDISSVEGRPNLEHHHKNIDVECKVMGRELETKVLPEDKDIYTEEQLREQLDTLRMITGYRAVPSLTLESELAGLYMFIGVEPPHSSGDVSNLTELSMKLRFLKSIVGVE